MEAAYIRREVTPVQLAPPRWRFAACIGEDPHAVARRNLRLMQERSPLPYTSAAWTPSGGHVMAAASTMPVGVAVAARHDLPNSIDTTWANLQDNVLVRRGIAPGALWLLKCAANNAQGKIPTVAIRAYRLVPLPHTHGEILLHHPSGWRGRGIAWWQEGALLSLVWQI
jgi:hypothetical protein